MNPDQFPIPKQNDRSLIEALIDIRDAFQSSGSVIIRVTPHVHASTPIKLPGITKGQFGPVQYIVDEMSAIMPNLWLLEDQSNRAILTVQRVPDQITDLVTVHWGGWGDQLPPPTNSQFYVRMFALARKHLRAHEVAATLSPGGNSDWDRYKDSQQIVLNSLQETGKELLVEFNRRTLEAERAAKDRYDTAEAKLRTEMNEKEAELRTQHAKREKEIDEREAAIKKRAEAFDTQEARYVARQEQDKQLEQLKGELKQWQLTSGTTKKRYPVLWAYLGGMAATASLVVFFSMQNTEILKSKTLTDVTWWQWVLLTSKPILAFVAFTSCLVYFLRWTSAWARQHAEEEFKNRTRVLDIGRSKWLLEAVRDAQDNKRELPQEFLKELSRNLFSNAGSPEVGELNPQAVSDVLMNGLSSIRVKSSDGSEVEATRGKKT